MKYGTIKFKCLDLIHQEGKEEKEETNTSMK